MNSSNSLSAHGFVRVAACSPEVHLGDVDANVKEITRAARELMKQGAQIIAFPELCITGYSCGDLFMNAAFRQKAANGLVQLVKNLERSDALIAVGLPLAVNDRLYNVAALINQGRIVAFIPKTYIPNSREFYEHRWFASAQTLSSQFAWIDDEWGAMISSEFIFDCGLLPGCRIGVELCEDLWAVSPPSSAAALYGANVILNLSASNELLGKAAYRRELVLQQSGRCLAAYVYAAAGPGESSTDLVFSGHSMIAENGVMLAEAERFDFKTNAIIADVDVQRLHQDRLHHASFRDRALPGVTMNSLGDLPSLDKQRNDWVAIDVVLAKSPKISRAKDLRRVVSAHPFVPSNDDERSAVCQEIFAIQSTGLARRIRAVKPKALVIGLSGGLDSTLALLVMREAVQRAGVATKIVAITMPGMGTTKRTKDNAAELANTLGVQLKTISIKQAVTHHLADIEHGGAHDVTFENAQARERTQILMDVANQLGGLVVGTGDLSEAALGWCTFNGDHMSMYHVNAGVPKTLVRYLIEWCACQDLFAKAAAVLKDILDTPISPELLPAGADGKIAQKTEDSVGPYELADFFLYYLVRHGCGEEKIAFLARLAFEGRYSNREIEKWLKHFLIRFRTQQFKRSSMPDGPKVGSVALSPRGDWRMPSDLAGGL